jgi:hypothetical protein
MTKRQKSKTPNAVKKNDAAQALMLSCNDAIIKKGQRSEGRTHLPGVRLLHGRLPGRSFARFARTQDAASSGSDAQSTDEPRGRRRVEGNGVF